MKVYKLETSQVIPINIDQCWDFFSNPENLQKITPPHMGFEIIDKVSDKMYAGQLIQYYIKPFLGWKLLWVTEITQVKEKAYFVDEQRFGPYKFWYHQHFFKQTEQGVEMRDVVHYVLPYGLLGSIMHKLFIKKQLNQIFSYRSKFIKSLFK